MTKKSSLKGRLTVGRSQRASRAAMRLKAIRDRKAPQNDREQAHHALVAAGLIRPGQRLATVQKPLSPPLRLAGRPVSDLLLEDRGER